MDGNVNEAVQTPERLVQGDVFLGLSSLQLGKGEIWRCVCHACSVGVACEGAENVSDLPGFLSPQAGNWFKLSSLPEAQYRRLHRSIRCCSVCRPEIDTGAELLPKKIVVHVGMMKAGSTSIQSAIQRAPDVDFLSALPLKETQFESLEESKAVLSELLDNHSDSDRPLFVSHEALINGRPKRCAKVLQAVVPDATVLIVTRSPRKYIQSQYKMLVSRLAGSIMPSEYIAEWEGIFRDHLDLNEVSSHFEHFRKRGDLRFMPFELLTSDPDRFWHAIEDIVDLKPGDILDTVPQVQNQSPDLAMVKVFLALNMMFADMVGSMREEDAKEVMQKVSSLEDQIFRSLNTVDKSEQREFAEKYKSSILGFSDEFDTQFSRMGVDVAKNMSVLKEIPEYQEFLSEYFN